MNMGFFLHAAIARWKQQQTGRTGKRAAEKKKGEDD
jgi:hypothetical protein